MDRSEGERVGVFRDRDRDRERRAVVDVGLPTLRSFSAFQTCEEGV